MQSAQIGIGFGEELRSVQIPECVRREVTAQEHGPVDVLQHAIRVLLRRDAQQLT